MMNRYLTAYFIVIMVFTGTLKTSASSVEELNSRFVHFFLVGDIPAWTQTLDSLRNKSLNREIEMTLLYGEYGLIGNLIGSGKSNEAQTHLELFETRVQKALQNQPNNGDLHAFAAAATAYRIAIQPWRAPFLSRTHNENIKKALEKGSQYGLPLVEQANSFYFRPSFVGGNKERALEFYEKAYAFFSTNQRNHWMYYNVAAWLGQAYANQGMKSEAEAMYLKILEEAPEFTWVRDELLPKLYEGKSYNFWSFQ
ncbi:tetratricopeptide repeat protein [Natronoflexus pectinivorans]|uniref:Tetratricopeptide repeat protein n=1 Tax=Natronoflexus pectinivorans TaxID=682526 RepID=A0A4R2GGV6_9BACT|nr:tetratricopeptide repeat protein [Natronoflexus pectinivorans]TCO07497.1 hypothetical protein EV194_108105 [Natronoflexus pectinivorans]